MKAIVQDEYGSSDVLQLEGIDKPEIGGDDVLVRVHEAGVDHGVRSSPLVSPGGLSSASDITETGWRP